ncbi:hypothetical protein [Providencia alcalifaciens]|uniref:hypothetical protein n=1 Tax=Providencia alcalifaciens TaxID=126385 RepID=UPI002AA0D805|nr:hypothetical protein [Providencia alcalifaciens]
MGTILWPGVHPGISFEVSMKGQAKKGGEIGINGEYYKGGQFMPGSSKTKKGDRASSAGPSAKPKRQLIEPGVFVEVSDGEKTIYSGIMAFVIVENGVMRQSVSDKAIAHYELTDTLPGLIERFNAGERYR